MTPQIKSVIVTAHSGARYANVNHANGECAIIMLGDETATAALLGFAEAEQAQAEKHAARASLYRAAAKFATEHNT